jgi:hypothetical protein
MNNRITRDLVDQRAADCPMHGVQRDVAHDPLQRRGQQ